MAYTIQGGKLKRRVETRAFNTRPDQIPEIVDALFYGNPAKPGWIEMYVNGTGRAAVNALFPKAVIEWQSLTTPNRTRGYDPAKIPTAWAGWETFEINVPDVVEHGGTNNLRPITGGVPLDETTQEQLAFLLAISAKHQGARAAWHGVDGVLSIVHPDTARN